VSDPREDCDFCQESQYVPQATGGGSRRVLYDLSGSRLIERNSVYEAIAGLGALTYGYVLIAPRRHVLSLGELAVADLSATFKAAWRLAAEIYTVYNLKTVIVEHGSSGLAETGSSACIVHGHIHLFPVPEHIDVTRFALLGGKEVSDLAELRSTAAERRNYYFAAGEPRRGYLHVNPHIRSQHARRIWAELVGLPEEWDWAMAPYLDRALATAETLRVGDATINKYVSDTPMAEALQETLATYDRSAEWYAARTHGFLESSRLKDEIDCLVKHSSGVILDAGCGTGRDSTYMAGPLKRRVIALDASGPMLAKVADAQRLERVLASVCDIPLSDESVGAVWCSAVLVHLDAVYARQALREFWRVLAPGGLARISVKEGRGHTREPIGDGLAPARHFYYYGEEQVCAMVRDAGFCLHSVDVDPEVNSVGRIQRWIKIVASKAA